MVLQDLHLDAKVDISIKHIGEAVFVAAHHSTWLRNFITNNEICLSIGILKSDGSTYNLDKEDYFGNLQLHFGRERIISATTLRNLSHDLIPNGKITVVWELFIPASKKCLAINDVVTTKKIERLEDLCAAMMIKNIDFNNAKNLYDWFKHMGLEKWKKAAVEFIASHWKEVKVQD